MDDVKSTLIKLSIVAATGLLVFAAACGGDDDDDGGDSTPASQATAASQPTSASTAAATAAGEPTDAPDDGTGGGDGTRFSDLSPENQAGVNTLCAVAADPAAGLSQANNLDVVLQAAQAGEYGPEIGAAAGPFSDAYAGTDPSGFDAAVADLKAACDDIGWTAP
jgi:hypothetical protein